MLLFGAPRHDILPNADLKEPSSASYACRSRTLPKDTWLGRMLFIWNFIDLCTSSSVNRNSLCHGSSQNASSVGCCDSNKSNIAKQQTCSYRITTVK